MTVSPRLAHTREELNDLFAGSRAAAQPIALVPTMGALHAGHAGLMQRARASVGADGLVVVSIFVNPMQFGAGEDLDTYPRTLEEDLAICAGQDVDIVFTPTVDVVYPDGEPQVTVDPGPLARELEGGFRPTHFHGVLTVVAKLFGLVRPDLAVFGEKDYQQLVLIRQMARDLCLDVEILGVSTLREPDGLAMSSRNSYLDAEERTQAAALPRTLFAARNAAAEGTEELWSAARAQLRDAPGVDLDYLELTGPALGPPPEVGEARLLIAARVGKTRLIDNIAVHLGPETSQPEEGGN